MPLIRSSRPGQNYRAANRQELQLMLMDAVSSDMVQCSPFKMSRGFVGKSRHSLQGPTFLLGQFFCPEYSFVWRRHFPPRCPLNFNGLSNKTQLCITTVVRTSSTCNIIYFVKETGKEVASWRDRGIDGPILLIRILQETNHRANCFVAFGHTGRRSKRSGEDCSVR
jgi:hypothetical protein